MKPPGLCLLLLLPASLAAAAATTAPSGRQLIVESLQKHDLPAFVYEEQTLVLTDSAGHNSVRSLRYFGRRDENGSRRLLVVETPAESRGVTLYVARDARGGMRRGAAAAAPLLGSDFSVADFEGEQPQDVDYEYAGSLDLNRVPHHVVRAVAKADLPTRVLGAGERRIYLRKDNLFVTRIDYLDRQGQPLRRQSFRDPRPDENGAWRPGMILMEDLSQHRRSLLKVERRVHSADYVPDSVFAGQP